MPVAAGAGGVFLPGPFGQLGGQLIDADRSGGGGDAAVGRHGQHIAQAVAAEGGAQSRVGAVDLVAGHPRCGHLRGDGAVDQGCASAGLVAKPRLLAGIPASSQRCGILGPGPRQVQGAVDEGVPARGGVGQIHRDLGVLDAPGGAGVLALHPDRMHPLLDIPGFIERPGSRRGRRRRRRRSHADRRGPPSASHFARDNRCCNPSGVASPRCSAIVQQFLRSRPETIPAINSAACRSGS